MPRAFRIILLLSVISQSHGMWTAGRLLAQPIDLTPAAFCLAIVDPGTAANVEPLISDPGQTTSMDSTPLLVSDNQDVVCLEVIDVIAALGISWPQDVLTTVFPNVLGLDLSDYGHFAIVQCSDGGATVAPQSGADYLSTTSDASVGLLGAGDSSRIMDSCGMGTMSEMPVDGMRDAGLVPPVAGGSTGPSADSVQCVGSGWNPVGAGLSTGNPYGDVILTWGVATLKHLYTSVTEAVGTSADVGGALLFSKWAPLAPAAAAFTFWGAGVHNVLNPSPEVTNYIDQQSVMIATNANLAIADASGKTADEMDVNFQALESTVGTYESTFTNGDAQTKVAEAKRDIADGRMVADLSRQYADAAKNTTDPKLVAEYTEQARGYARSAAILFKMAQDKLKEAGQIEAGTATDNQNRTTDGDMSECENLRAFLLDCQMKNWGAECQDFLRNIMGCAEAVLIHTAPGSTECGMEVDESSLERAFMEACIGAMRPSGPDVDPCAPFEGGINDLVDTPDQGGLCDLDVGGSCEVRPRIVLEVRNHCLPGRFDPPLPLPDVPPLPSDCFVVVGPDGIPVPIPASFSFEEDILGPPVVSQLGSWQNPQAQVLDDVLNWTDGSTSTWVFSGFTTVRTDP